MNNYLISQFNKAAYTKNFVRYETNAYKKFLTSDEVKLSNSGFYGVAYINEESKEIVIANSGTNFDVFGSRWIKKLDFSVVKDFMQDAYSDIELYFGYVPSQYNNGAEKFINEIVSHLGEQAHDYKFITTGHSLGAVLSSLENAKLKAMGYQVSSVNIDSPGSKPIVEEYIKNNNLNIRSSDLDVVTYNAPKHLVNAIHEELGNVYEFVMPTFKNSFFGSIMETIHNHTFGNIAREAFNVETQDFAGVSPVSVEVIYPAQESESFTGINVPVFNAIL